MSYQVMDFSLLGAQNLVDTTSDGMSFSEYRTRAGLGL